MSRAATYDEVVVRNRRLALGATYASALLFVIALATLRAGRHGTAGEILLGLGGLACVALTMYARRPLAIGLTIAFLLMSILRL